MRGVTTAPRSQPRGAWGTRPLGRGVTASQGPGPCPQNTSTAASRKEPHLVLNVVSVRTSQENRLANKGHELLKEVGPPPPRPPPRPRGTALPPVSLWCVGRPGRFQELRQRTQAYGKRLTLLTGASPPFGRLPSLWNSWNASCTSLSRSTLSWNSSSGFLSRTTDTTMSSCKRRTRGAHEVAVK